MKNVDYKLKLLYVKKVLAENTDENHFMTMQEILAELKKYGIDAERKSVYDDIETLRKFGLEIVGERRNKQYYYALLEREFELVELKLLVDAVQSAKFITEKKSQQLIAKLEGLVSKHEASTLQRQIYITGKGDKFRTVYINDKMVHAIREYLKVRKSNSPYLFVFRVSEKMAMSRINQIFN